MSFLTRTSAIRNSSMAALLVIGAFAGVAQPSARADIYVLTNGGQVRGELTNPNESPRRQYVIRTAAGATVTIDRAQLKQIVPQSSAELEYEKIRPTFPDTAEGQWQLAEWCLENSLKRQRTAALERVIELEPDHRQARIGLGYSQVEGRWVQPEQFKKERGFVRYKGTWMLPQEIELYESRRKDELSQKKWFADIKLWRRWLDDPPRAKEAEESLRSINDPTAVAPLVQALKQDNHRPLRVVYVQALGRIATPAAQKALVAFSLGDADTEIRLSCLDQLIEKPGPKVTDMYVTALRDKDNRHVNRAGYALGKLGDKTAIRPLIDALLTTHKFQVTEGGGPNSISAGFDASGSGGFSFGGGGPKIIKTEMTNQRVLDALVTLTDGVDFNFDQHAWRHWYASQQKAAKANPRRD